MDASSLLSLATAVPPHVAEQRLAKDVARRAFGGKAVLFERLSGVFDNAAIAKRHLVAPLEWYEASHGWAERNAVYLAAAEELFERAAGAAIVQAGLIPADIDGVVTVSTTGIATPSRDAPSCSGRCAASHGWPWARWRKSAPAFRYAAPFTCGY